MIRDSTLSVPEAKNPVRDFLGPKKSLLGPYLVNFGPQAPSRAWPQWGIALFFIPGPRVAYAGPCGRGLRTPDPVQGSVGRETRPWPYLGLRGPNRMPPPTSGGVHPSGWSKHTAGPRCCPLATPFGSAAGCPGAGAWGMVGSGYPKEGKSNFGLCGCRSSRRGAYVGKRHKQAFSGRNGRKWSGGGGSRSSSAWGARENISPVAGIAMRGAVRGG